MLWDIIRDFFVQYIFGGCVSSGEFYRGLVGYGNGEWDDTIYTDAFSFKVGYDASGNNHIMLSLGDWLSTTATIIVLCLVILFFIKLTIWFFKQGAGLFKW